MKLRFVEKCTCSVDSSDERKLSYQSTTDSWPAVGGYFIFPSCLLIALLVAFIILGVWNIVLVTACGSIGMAIATLGLWYSSVQAIVVDLDKDLGTLHVETYCVNRGSSEPLQAFRRAKGVELARIKEVYINKRLLSVFSDLCMCTIFALESGSWRPTMLYRGIDTQEAEDIQGKICLLLWGDAGYHEAGHSKA